MDVYVDKPKCTGCEHCKDVCPVNVFDIIKIEQDVNTDHAPEEMKFKGQHDPATFAKFSTANDGHTHFKDKSSGARGSDCILCQACLIQCEGECIHIFDDSGNTYKSIYQ